MVSLLISSLRGTRHSDKFSRSKTRMSRKFLSSLQSMYVVCHRQFLVFMPPGFNGSGHLFAVAATDQIAHCNGESISVSTFRCHAKIVAAQHFRYCEELFSGNSAGCWTERGTFQKGTKTGSKGKGRKLEGGKGEMISMPRTARASAANYCYHVLNRGNGRAQVFHKGEDYEAFIGLIQEACSRLPMRVVGYCLMPSHFHLVVWPRGDGDLSRWMQWLLTSHVRRYHRHYHSSGHVWQGRFKAFPIVADDHLRSVLRYVERNPLRARLVAKAEEWGWSSLRILLASEGTMWLDPGPAPRGGHWLQEVNGEQDDAEEDRIRECGRRGRPYGDEVWSRETASALGLESSLRPRGRPRKLDPA